VKKQKNKKMPKKKSKKKNTVVEPVREHTDEERDVAARTIQRNFRVYRQKMKFRLTLLAAAWNALADDEEKSGLREAQELISLRPIIAQQMELSDKLQAKFEEEHGKSKSKKSSKSSKSSSKSESGSASSSSGIPKLDSRWRMDTALLEGDHDCYTDDESGYFLLPVPDKVTDEFVVLLMKKFAKNQRLAEYSTRTLLTRTKELLAQRHETPVNRVPFPRGEGARFTVVGDLHGQLPDLLCILKRNGLPSATNVYLFNGDLVDRGPNGVEICLIVFAWMLACPQSVYVNRGNHEALSMNAKYAYDAEVLSKYDESMFDLFQELFCLLPLCTVFAKQVFVCHGGLPAVPGAKLGDIEAIDHRRQVPGSCAAGADAGDVLFKQLLWNDPRPIVGSAESSRGSGICYFGEDVTREFLSANDLSLVIRSHELVEDGYAIMHGHQVITVFSASNYCQKNENFGAVVMFGDANTLSPSFLRYHAEPVDGLPSQSAFSANALEEEVLQQLSDRIFVARDELEAAYEDIDTECAGRVTLLEWRRVLTTVLGLPLPFLSLKPILFREDYGAILPGDGRLLDYNAFLKRYKISLTANLVERWESVVLDDIVTKIVEAQGTMEATFDRLDLDHDGFVSAQELVAVARDHDINLNRRQVKTVLSLVNAGTDGGGYSRERFLVEFERLHARIVHQRQHEKRWMRTAIRKLIDIMERDMSSVRAAYSSFDKYERGTLSHKRFAHTVDALLPNELSKTQRYELATYVDVDGNGEISLAEFETAFSALAKRYESTKWMKRSVKQLAAALISHRQSLKLAFREFDTDNSGTIDAQEFRVAMRAFNHLLDDPLTDEQIGHLYHALDRDNDGVIAWREFMSSFSVRVRSKKSMKSSKRSKSASAAPSSSSAAASSSSSPSSSSSSSSTEATTKKWTSERLSKWKQELTERERQLDEREHQLDIREADLMAREKSQRQSAEFSPEE
jgi:protein phosphatase